MKIEYDPIKRAQTWAERELDFARSLEVFQGMHLTGTDERRNYAEVRFITVGKLDGRLVVLVWTLRGEVRRIISMRKANEREKAHFEARLDRP
jgi:uncharacterized DUF497 family protein